MIAFLLWTAGVVLFIAVACALTGIYKLHTDTRFRIFFDMKNEENGSVSSINMCVFGETKKEAEKNLREIVQRNGKYSLIIYETEKVEPDHNLTEL